MLTPKSTFIFSILVATALLLVPFADGQKSTDVLPAPFPVQITRGKTVFISNAGGDTNDLYSGGHGCSIGNTVDRPILYCC